MQQQEAIKVPNQHLATRGQRLCIEALQLLLEYVHTKQNQFQAVEKHAVPTTDHIKCLKTSKETSL